MRGSAPAPRMWGSYPHTPAFALYSTYFLIHRHCLRPRIVRRVVRHDPRPVRPGGPVNAASFRRAIGADKTAAICIAFGVLMPEEFFIFYFLFFIFYFLFFIFYFLFFIFYFLFFIFYFLFFIF